MISVGIIILAGIVFSKLAKLVKAPAVTGYLIGGIVIGPAVLNLINNSQLQSLGIVSELALSLIAFSIGAEFNLKQLKKLGKNIITITVSQALITFVVVYLTMAVIFSLDAKFSLLLAAISCATAPAATIMVINQYKADGPLVRTLLPVVAIDDAVCILVFGISLSIVKSISSGSALSLMHMFKEPLVEIVLSLLLGLAGGLIFSLSYKFVRNNDECLITVLGTVFLCAGLAIKFNLSSLLTCMVVGAVVANLLGEHKRIFHLAENFSPPIYLMFFTAAGCGLHLSELRHIGMTGLFYICARGIGKMAGAAIGAKLAHAPGVISKYLGLGLMPQAGVAIGLTTLVSQAFPDIGPTLTTIVLGGVVIFEMIGPFLAKFALEKAGEINCKKAIVATTHN